MLKNLTLIFWLGLFCGALRPLTAMVTALPANASLGQPVLFTITLATSDTINAAAGIDWNFSDGGPIVHMPASAHTVTHQFYHTGSYTVTAAYTLNARIGPMVHIVDPAVVSVTDPRRLVFSPMSPNTGETVQFSAQNFFTTTIRWEFGDGTIIPAGGSQQGHAYAQPGTFQVNAYDQGFSTPISAMVTVTEKRRLTYLPAQPKPGQTVIFTASGFIGPQLLWDFGDGTSLIGSATQAHLFKTNGNFQVTARDNAGGSSLGIATQVRVVLEEGPASPFGVSYVALRFVDGKAQTEVRKGFAPLVAYADIKTEGSGNLLVVWKVDGVVFASRTHTVTFAQALTIDSGTVPGLPTIVPGRHILTLEIAAPQTGLVIPPIAYIVTIDPVDRAPVVDAAQPSEVAPGREYKVGLKGRNLDATTRISFASGIAVLGKPLIKSATEAEVTLFVPRTTQSGAYSVCAENDRGATSGPGLVVVKTAPRQSAELH
jgi:hypothetical protein